MILPSCVKEAREKGQGITMNADGVNNNNNNAEEGGDGIDVGILNGADQDEQSSNNIDDSTNANDQEEEDEDENSYDAEPSSLYDVYSSLNYANYTGSCCASDKADGTTLSPALPTTLGLRVNGVGDVPLPLTDYQAKTLKSNKNTTKIDNGTYHKTYSINSKLIRIKNPTWEASLEKLVKTVAFKLGVNPSKLSAELHSLLYMEKGSRVDRCKNIDEGANNVLGTLFVQLPSVFTGGKVSIFNNGEGDYWGVEEDIPSTFQLGAAGDASFSCHFVCHFKDCEYEFAKIKSGSRVLLRYTLRYGEEEKAPTAHLLNKSISSLKWSLDMLPPADRMLLIPMAKRYTAASLVNKGINAFSPKHRARVEAIKAAAGEGWKLLIVTAELKHTRKSGYYGNTISQGKESSVTTLFDEAGNDVSREEKWLKNLVDFEPMEDDGMMLSDNPNGYGANWGSSVNCTSSETYYGDTVRKRTYRASFVLAYDTAYSESELKCLTGTKGVAEIVDEIVVSRDYGMLERVLKVVENKKKSKFDVRSCQKLLQMLIRSRSQNALSSNRIEFVNKILCGLSSSLEPDDQLYDMILSVVDKFGHENITESIWTILYDGTRMKDHDLLFFLRRAQFILTLNKTLENGSQYLENSISDLTASKTKTIGNSTNANTKIFSMIAEHGWEEMASVVEAALSFLHSKASVNATNRSIETLLERASLVWKLHDYPCDFIQSSLEDFAEDFANGIHSNCHKATRHLKDDATQKIFTKAIHYLMTHGTDASLKHLGNWASLSEETLTSLLTAITTHSTELEYDAQVFLRDFLNKCLVQHSTSGWLSHRREDRTVDPSLHIQRVLKDHPNLPRMIDGDGRITLHYAAIRSQSTSPRRYASRTHNKGASPETIGHILKANPAGASVRDPVTGVYPFMLTAVSDKVASVSATYSLLLANPSLVMSGIQEVSGVQEEVDTAGRKRKRSDSDDASSSSLLQSPSSDVSAIM